MTAWPTRTSSAASLGGIGYTILSIVALLGSVAGVAGLIWVAARGHRDREDEDSARAYFDVHGRWPDEP